MMAEVAENMPAADEQSSDDAANPSVADGGDAMDASTGNGALSDEQTSEALPQIPIGPPPEAAKAEAKEAKQPEAAQAVVQDRPDYVAEDAIPAEVPEGEAIPSVTAVMNDRYVIDGGRPVPEMDTASAKAYAVVDRQNQGEQLVGLVCSPAIPVRTELLQRLKDQSVRGLLQVIEWDAIDWPPVGGKTMCIIYERPLGGRVIDSIAQGKARISEYDAVNKLIEPMMGCISSLETMAQPHRSIRPGNLHFLDEARTTVVLGDCCSGPPGYSQPPIFETIERCTASPSGRGFGTSGDDIYAMGVTIIITLLGYNPGKDKRLSEMLAIKLERGSYAAICGNARIPIALVEPLRGMLNDDELSRWSTEELRSWLDGRKRTPQQRKGQPRAGDPVYLRQSPAYEPKGSGVRVLSRPGGDDPDYQVG